MGRDGQGKRVVAGEAQVRLMSAVISDDWWGKLGQANEKHRLHIHVM